MTSNLRKFRKAANVPVAALARRARVSPGTISLDETYGMEPNHDQRWRIASVLNLDVASIWPLNPEPTAAPTVVENLRRFTDLCTQSVTTPLTLLEENEFYSLEKTIAHQLLEGYFEEVTGLEVLERLLWGPAR